MAETVVEKRAKYFAERSSLDLILESLAESRDRIAQDPDHEHAPKWKEEIEIMKRAATLKLDRLKKVVKDAVGISVEVPLIPQPLPEKGP